MTNKYFTLFLLGCLSVLSLSGQKFIQEEYDQIHKNCRHAKLTPTVYKNTAAEVKNNYDIVYNRCEWEVDPAKRYIKGAIHCYFISKEDALNKLGFHMNHALSVDSVIFRKEKVNFQKESDHSLHISLSDNLEKGKLDSIHIYYQGVPPNNGMGAFSIDTHNETPVLWTLSEPYGAQDWWPCKQTLNDKIDSIDIIVTSPQQYRTASNGLLVSEKSIDGKTICHWKHRYPIPAYLVAIAVTNYEIYNETVSNNGNPFPIINYVYPEDKNSAQTLTPATVDIMNFFIDKFGNYPFEKEKYGHAQFGWGGGMEHQTMSFMYNFSYSLVAHELAHQWFGDKITCGSWRDIWLNEGFATYLTGLCYEFLSSNSTDFKNWKTSTSGKVLSATDGCLYVKDTTSISQIFSSRISYNKGAYVLHMIRKIMGDKAFFAAVKDYISDPDLIYSYAKTNDLKKHFTYHSNYDWDEFFQDWIYGEGYPIYQMNWSANNTDVELELKQTTSHASVSFFEMPVPIYFSDNNGNDTIVKLQHSKSPENFSFKLKFTPKNAVLDPEIDLLKGSGSTSINELQINQIAKVFPNPVDKEINVQLGKKFTQCELSITDLSGRKLLEKNYLNTSSIQKELDFLKTGTYIIKLDFGTEVFTQKFVKQ